jgi:peptidoglycan-associated lipoprotein
MRKFAVLSMAVVLFAGAMFVLSGCGSREDVVEEPIIDPTVAEETDALVGDDLVLHEQPEDVVYIEPGSSIFDDIHFDFDSYEILSLDAGTLQEISIWLTEHEDIRVMVEGHCDERGTNEYNMALGEQRALAARRYLVHLGIASSRLGTISYGEESPFDPRSTEDAWAKNRRAHFVISE